MGWRPSFFSEIDQFPRAVLQHHYPAVPLHGDFTTIREGDYEPIDLLVGGTPCQSFSVAGLRKGLDDPRGNLMLGFGALADRLRPRWLVWENVPGVLSSNGGRDFGSFLGMLGLLGYGFAYRILDAQHFGVPQRRRRVFVVGHLGDWRRAAAVLFERHSLSGNPAPSRKARQDVAPTISARTKGGGGLGTDFDCDGGLIARSVALRGREGGATAELGDEIGNALRASSGGGDKAHVLVTSGPEIARCVATREGSSQDYETTTILAVTHSLRGEGFDASEDGTGRGTPLVPVAFAIQAGALRENPDSGPDGVGVQPGCAYTLEARAEVQAVAFAFDTQQITSAANRTRVGAEFPVSTLAKASNMHAYTGSAVRRLTPRECERLQGFPDDFTLVPYRNKPAADGPRYKALGNSMAVPVMRWIGERIEAVESLSAIRKAA